MVKEEEFQEVLRPFLWEDETIDECFLLKVLIHGDLPFLIELSKFKILHFF